MAWGVLLIRLTFLSGLFWFLCAAFRKSKVNHFLSLGLLLGFLIFFLENYALERPQVVTFLGVGLLLILYRHVRDELGSFSFAWVIVLPACLMAVWANSHAGVVVGQGIVSIVIFVETVFFLAVRDSSRYKRLLVFSLSAIIGSLLSPNSLSFDLLLELLRNNDNSLHLNNMEYFSVYKWLFVYKQYKLLLVLLIFFASVFFTVSAFRKRNYAEICVFLVVWFYAFKHVRYVPIALVVSLLFVSWNYYHSLLVKRLSYFVILCAFGAFCMWSFNDLDNYKSFRTHGLISTDYFPVDAVRFLDENKLYGRVFNPINWGGYLIWKLYPHSKFFVDSRYLDSDLIAQNKRIYGLERSQQGKLLWVDLMDRDRVNIALLPLYDGRGRPLLLSQSFERSREWDAVYRDNLSVVFVRSERL